LLGFAAVNTGNNLIYLMASALLGFMAISGFLGKSNLSKISIHCTPPEEVYDGLPTLFSVNLKNNRRWLPIFLMEVVLQEQAVLFPLVDPGQARSKSLETVLYGRGVQRLARVTVRSRFPINFFIRSMTVPIDREVTVFPRPLPCNYPQQPDPGGVRGADKFGMKGQDGDVSQISDYRGGEPLKMIHWKLSARHDRLKVKELSAATRTPVTINLDAIAASGLEQRLSYCTYLVTRMLRSGRPVGLRAGAMEIPPDSSRQHKLMLLKVLATHGTD
jgi:uncharacterized protein (DUF58 family)